MGDSMGKETNKKKKTTSTNSKKSTETKKVAPVKASTNNTAQAKKGNSASAKKTDNNVKTTSKDKKEVVKNTVKTVVKTEVKTEKVKNVAEKPIIDVKKEEIKVTSNTDVEHADKKEIKKEKLLVENNEFTNLIKIVLIVTGIFLAFYLLTYLITKNSEDKKKDIDDAEVTIQYDEILMSNLLKQSKSEYYVLAYDAKDVYYDAYNTYLTSYSSKTNALRVYKSILSNGFNKSYYDAEGESKTDVSSIEDLKLNLSTLIKVKDGKIESVYEGHDAIISQLKSLTAK